MFHLLNGNPSKIMMVARALEATNQNLIIIKNCTKNTLVDMYTGIKFEKSI